MPNEQTSSNMILEAHEDRLQEIERNFTALNNQFLPAIARLEAVVEHGFSAVNSRLDSGERRFTSIEHCLGAIERTAADKATTDFHRDITLQTLQKTDTERAEARRMFRRWLLGVTGTFLVALVLAVLGLK